MSLEKFIFSGIQEPGDVQPGSPVLPQVGCDMASPFLGKQAASRLGYSFPAAAWDLRPSEGLSLTWLGRLQGHGQEGEAGRVTACERGDSGTPNRLRSGGLLPF